MITIQRPNSRPVITVLAFVLAVTTLSTAIIAPFQPAMAYAGAQYSYKSEPQWYNGPVARPSLGGDTMAFVTVWEGNGWNLYTTDLEHNKDLKISGGAPVSHAVEPVVSGSRVAWKDQAGNKFQVKVFNKLGFSTTLVADSANEIGRPALSGNTVVWRAANAEQSGSQILSYDLTVHQLSTLSSGKFHSDPVISGSRIAWFETSNACSHAFYRLCAPAHASWNLVMYDAANGLTQTIATGVDTKYAPAMTESRIVWTARVNGQHDLYQYGLMTGETIRLTSDELEEAFPATSNGRIAYIGIPFAGSPKIVRVINPVTGENISMAYKNADHEHMTISGDRVAWSEHRTDSRIYIYDFAASGAQIDEDNDSLPASIEAQRGSDDSMKDTDGDGIPDTDEVVLFNTNPTTVDSDGDGLSDYKEVYLYKTNPILFDTDGDGFNDGKEIQNRFSPTSAKPQKLKASFHYEWSVPTKIVKK